MGEGLVRVELRLTGWVRARHIGCGACVLDAKGQGQSCTAGFCESGTIVSSREEAAQVARDAGGRGGANKGETVMEFLFFSRLSLLRNPHPPPE